MADQDPINVRLAEMIQAVGPGTRLPSERAMAESLGVSRVALRDRLQGFEFLGILERRPGSGTVVRSLDPTGLAYMLDLMLASAHVSHADLHVVRIALERESARQAAMAKDLDLEEMYRCLYIFEHGGRAAEMAAADSAFHSHLMRLTGSPGLTFFADALQMSLFKSLQYRNQRWSKRVGAQNLLVELHTSIVKVIESQDPDAAALAVDAHFATFDRLVAQRKSTSKTAAKPKAS